MKHPPVPKEIKAAVIARREAGEDYGDIAKALGLTRRSVYGIWDRHTFFNRPVEAPPAALVTDPRTHVVVGLHGVSLPRLRCLEAA